MNFQYAKASMAANVAWHSHRSCVASHWTHLEHHFLYHDVLILGRWQKHHSPVVIVLLPHLSFEHLCTRILCVHDTLLKKIRELLLLMHKKIRIVKEYHVQTSLTLPKFFSLPGIHVAFYSAPLFVQCFLRPFCVLGTPLVSYSSLPSFSTHHLQLMFLLLWYI